MGEPADSVEKAVAAPLLPAGRAVLVACSGGADSVALAHAMAVRGDLRISVGHIDHALRPESRQEAEQVEALARQLRVPFFVERLEALPLAASGLEAAARAARYAALARLAAKAAAGVVATAHTRRDQAETLLLRLIRGAGPGAMAGIRKERELAQGVRLLRPLLGVSREATEAYCRNHGLLFTMDPHNSDPRRARAQLRALWPLLLAMNPRLEEAIAGAAELFADEDDLLRTLAMEQGRGAAHPALQRRALHAAAVAAGLRPERRHLEEIRRLVAEGRGSVDLPGGRATIQQDSGTPSVSFRKVSPDLPNPPAEAMPAEVAVPGPGSYRWRSRELSVALGPTEEVAVDLARAPFPWTIRSQRPGDRFRPAGGRTKKVADLWIDARVPRELRPNLALLADAQGQVFWVEKLREGDPSRPPGSASASFRIR